VFVPTIRDLGSDTRTRAIRGQSTAWDPADVQWLAVSVVASLVLTVLANLAIRLWPGAAEKGTRRLAEWSERQEPPDARPGQARVIVPWKAMLIGSIVLTIVLNVALRLF
jgi:hypothetical protein